jgi:iron complex outermembrane recepter protein
VSTSRRAIASFARATSSGALLFLGSLIFTAGALGQVSPSASKPLSSSPAQRDLSQVPLEDLMNVHVTSVSKKEQNLSEAAAAIFVITQEDIHRSGASNVPDLLRLVPGLDVAQINANNWAISSRGFNTQFANKLLVLIDGRAVYTPLLGGVNWDTQDLPLEDIDRIEVVRGPGATLWGANAVNGVINIVTKTAAETKGGLMVAGGGTQGQGLATVQYGGTLGGITSYRVFTKYLNHGPLPELDGFRGDDAWNLLHGGFRADTMISSKDSFTLQGDFYGGTEGGTIVHIFSIDPPIADDLDTRLDLSGGNVLSRWHHEFSGRSDTTLQFYFDNYTRTGPEASETRKTIDFDFNHHMLWGARQDIIWGLGYRRTYSKTLGTIDQAFNPPETALDMFNAFVQDTITLKSNRVFLTAGTKFENSYFAGYGVDPSIRLAWTPSKAETFWAAVSRATRSPAQRETGLSAALAVFPDPEGSNTPVEVILFGNPKFIPEHVIAYETGYRAQAAGRLSLDVSLFYNQYDHLETLEPGTEFLQSSPAPARFVLPIMFGNLMHGTTEGVEIFANLKLTDRWTLSPEYAFLEMHVHTKPASQDTLSATDYQGSDPQHQAKLRSHVELSHGLSWDATANFESGLPFHHVASYTRLDTQLSWKFAERGEFSLVGQNLLQDHHIESLDVLTLVNSALIKRSAYAKFVWRFW